MDSSSLGNGSRRGSDGNVRSCGKLKGLGFDCRNKEPIIQEYFQPLAPRTTEPLDRDREVRVMGRHEQVPRHDGYTDIE